ncbi:oligopeptide ABC transporter, permease protein OppB [Mycoplasma sp. NEAQ87857]|uniref:ABC transporter permease n=1 Tax=Mycoplasma sp. NEAQ87857 TaxID=2683967 RepID=UPI001319AB1C|nr:ABC transporter permease [Mycoplasma sp. NEAQ87857]QGZ97495.1 oligopeptide ABC transporter, permease protein OppB [Mycoplasma sp. NEAQ87857]
MLFKTKIKNDDNHVILSNQRNTSLKLWQKLLAIDSPILKSTWKLIKTFIEFIIVAWIVITIVFFLINIVPGSNALTAGLKDANQRAAIEEQYGLNLPLIQRYFNYLKGILHGDFGISLSLFPGQEINSFIWERFYKSFLVGIFSVLITVVLGISIGVYVGKNPGGLADNISTIIISVFSSVPSLIFALVLVFIGRSIHLPYAFEEKDFLTYILPGLALSLSSILVYIKYIRTEWNREINSVHAKFAYLKGLSKNRFVWKHALKPSLFPIATFFPAVVLGSFIGGFFIEQIFFIPGSGATFLQAIQSKDYNVILFLITLYTLLTILSYTLRDILYEAIDPRVRRKAK